MAKAHGLLLLTGLLLGSGIASAQSPGTGAGGAAQNPPPSATSSASTTSSDGQREHRDWGWIGLLGLAGLAGLMGRNRNRADPPSVNTSSRPPGGVR
ncbi:MAG: hypothetical protein JWM36_1027 [Hyphomicrobiales bacterium]|nr:hypothetical protein [Hyphomicrobiales bacterium]